MRRIIFATLLLLCRAAPTDKDEIVVEVPLGKNAVLTCASNDNEHIFAFWELAKDGVIGPGNDYNPHKYDYQVLSGTLTIRHVSTDQEGVYTCVSKALRDDYNIKIRKVRMIVKKDWEDVYETDTNVNFFRIVVLLASAMIVLGGGYFIFKKWKRRHPLHNMLEDDDDEDSAEEIFRAPGTSKASGNIILDRTDKSLEDGDLSTDFVSILDSANK